MPHDPLRKKKTTRAGGHYTIYHTCGIRWGMNSLVVSDTCLCEQVYGIDGLADSVRPGRPAAAGERDAVSI